MPLRGDFRFVVAAKLLLFRRDSRGRVGDRPGRTVESPGLRPITATPRAAPGTPSPLRRRTELGASAAGGGKSRTFRPVTHARCERRPPPRRYVVTNEKNDNHRRLPLPFRTSRARAPAVHRRRPRRGSRSRHRRAAPATAPVAATPTGGASGRRTSRLRPGSARDIRVGDPHARPRTVERTRTRARARPRRARPASRRPSALREPRARARERTIGRRRAPATPVAAAGAALPEAHRSSGETRLVSLEFPG